jgi:hypothetical protein
MREAFEQFDSDRDGKIQLCVRHDTTSKTLLSANGHRSFPSCRPCRTCVGESWSGRTSRVGRNAPPARNPLPSTRRRCNETSDTLGMASASCRHLLRNIRYDLRNMALRLGEVVEDDLLQSMLRDADADADDGINFEEFKNILVRCS